MTIGPIETNGTGLEQKFGKSLSQPTITHFKNSGGGGGARVTRLFLSLPSLPFLSLTNESALTLSQEA